MERINQCDKKVVLSLVTNGNKILTATCKIRYTRIQFTTVGAGNKFVSRHKRLPYRNVYIK